MNSITVVSLVRLLDDIRGTLETTFHEDTRYPGTVPNVPSAGHCALVAGLLAQLYPYIFDVVSTTVQGQSHWFNRCTIDGIVYDVDLTGDQFGGPTVLVRHAGLAYGDARCRSQEEWSIETWSRFEQFYRRFCGL